MGLSSPCTPNRITSQAGARHAAPWRGIGPSMATRRAVPTQAAANLRCARKGLERERPCWAPQHKIPIPINSYKQRKRLSVLSSAPETQVHYLAYDETIITSWNLFFFRYDSDGGSPSIYPRAVRPWTQLQRGQMFVYIT